MCVFMILVKLKRTSLYLKDIWAQLIISTTFRYLYYERTKPFCAQAWSYNAWMSVGKKNITVSGKEHCNSEWQKGSCSEPKLPLASCLLLSSTFLAKKKQGKMEYRSTCVCLGAGNCIHVSFMSGKGFKSAYARLLKEARTYWTLNWFFRSHTVGVYGGKCHVSTVKSS